MSNPARQSSSGFQPPSKKHHEEPWLISYADMMTLLFGFFVLMYVFAQGGKDNDKLLGEEKDAVFWEVIKLASRYDQVEATMRPDLSYVPANKSN